MRHAWVLVASVSVVAALPVRAQSGNVWRCMDAAGRPQYTNVKGDTEGRNCTLVTREVSVVQNPVAAKPAAMSPGAAPGASVDPRTQRARDDNRRKILTDELATEQHALEKAKEALSEQESIRNGDERNYQRVLDRLQPYQNAVAQHERNVDAIQKELASLK